MQRRLAAGSRSWQVLADTRLSDASAARPWYTMARPCCPLYLRDSPVPTGLAPSVGRACGGPLSSKATLREERCQSFCLSVRPSSRGTLRLRRLLREALSWRLQCTSCDWPACARRRRPGGPGPAGNNRPHDSNRRVVEGRVARPRWPGRRAGATARWCSSKARCRARKCGCRCTAARTTGSRRPASTVTARARSGGPRCPHFGCTRAPAAAARCSTCTSARAGRDQAARARGQPLAPRQGAGPRCVLRPIEGPDLGLPLARALFGAPRAQEGHGAGRLPRAQEPLRGRHARDATSCRRTSAHCCCRCAS